MSHPSCQHICYRLTCDEYDALVERSAGVCERCAIPAKLVIDHDHTFGFRGVRGLLCRKCNAHLAFVDHGRKPLDEATVRYLALQQLKQRS